MPVLQKKLLECGVRFFSIFCHPSAVSVWRHECNWHKFLFTSLQPLIVAFLNMQACLTHYAAVLPLLSCNSEVNLFFCWHREHLSDSACTVQCCTCIVLLIACGLFVIQRWREFYNLFEGQVEDWNMATLLRIDASGDVSEQNTVIGMCFCAIHWNIWQMLCVTFPY